MPTTDAAVTAPILSPKRYSLMDTLVIVGSVLGVLSTLLVAYNSYNSKFDDINKQIYDIKGEQNLIRTRLSYHDASIKTISENQDRANSDTRDRLDKIKDSIALIHDEITRGNANVRGNR